ncbi:AraC family transcriptional regulator [Rhodospirillales bacterium TMPK1]|uniref:AraC family transcriptional regulator n=1 Tax=Roseiterribacter gracilis TaxID=2812848 RepID=A0A8S8XJA5_9PROT|nr:AraC family transcriptional regulator [Rhodospirillales bacterium TMPK1]
MLFDNALALDVTGPGDAFATANQFATARDRPYRLVYLSRSGGKIRTAGGLVVQTEPVAAFDLATLDTLIVAGGVAIEQAARDAALLDWIRTASRRARRTCSVCTGAWLLAAAGLLDRKRAATHWSKVDALRAAYPKVRVELDPIYVRDGKIWTSAGVTAGIDLALALIEDDFGAQRSLAVAKELVVFLRRPGGQAQFSNALAAQAQSAAQQEHARLDAVRDWMQDHLARDCSVETLAARAGMAPRSFARHFAARFGTTPAKRVEELRLEAAQRALHDGDAAIKQIAARCGFGDEERMRRAFVRRFGVAPSAYRARFRGEST